MYPLLVKKPKRLPKPKTKKKKRRKKSVPMFTGPRDCGGCDRTQFGRFVCYMSRHPEYYEEVFGEPYDRQYLKQVAISMDLSHTKKSRCQGFILLNKPS